MNELLDEEESCSQSQDLNQTKRHEVPIATTNELIITTSGESFDVIVKSDSLDKSSLYTNSPINLSKPLVSSTPIVSNKIKK